MMIRCEWCTDDPMYQAYHDLEWGRPVHDDRLLFEMLNLEGAQAGLSWITVLKKRDRYRYVFDNFDAEKIVRYNQQKVESLLLDPGIIRNRLKVNAVISNARAYLKLIESEGGFAAFIWQFTDGKIRLNHPKSIQDLPSKTRESEAMSKALRDRGFRFVGSTICYAFMQAVGMVNDHTSACWLASQAQEQA